MGKKFPVTASEGSAGFRVVGDAVVRTVELVRNFNYK